MNKNFNLFRLNCMMDDNKSKNYNSIIVSLISELLFENDNSEINREECYSHIVNGLKIKLQKDLFVSIIEKSQNFIHVPNKTDIGIKLTDQKFKEIHDNVANHSIDKHITDFISKNSLSIEYKRSIEALLYQAIYENINSFSVQNIDSIIPWDIKEDYSKDEIDAFNGFLSESNREKNTALFNTFLKAVEFAIITSGKGVKEFTKGVFEGKEYLLDTNIIFRLLGVGGKERQESLVNLIEQCNHQGIKFKYTSESYLEFKRKVESSIRDIKRATEKKSIEILSDLMQEKFEFNNGFITHYAECILAKEIRSPEQYETKIMADFRILCQKFDLGQISLNGKLKTQDISKLQIELFNEKKSINEFSNYTKTAAKVDSTNVLSVRVLRGSNNYNYTDIKSFYLSTDRTLNRILANRAGEKIAETILPSQLYILHNSLSEDHDNQDYEAFTKFLKRRTTEFKITGKQVLNYIEEIRNYTNEPENIKEIIKAYSDKKYETTLLDLDVESVYLSISEFAETYIDRKLKSAELGDEKYQMVLENAVSEFPKILKFSKKIVRIIDILLTTLIIPVTVLISKTITDNIYIISTLVVIMEAVKFIISSRWAIFSDWTKKIFLWKVNRSSYNKTFRTIDKTYLKAANDFVKDEIKVWK